MRIRLNPFLLLLLVMAACTAQSQPGIKIPAGNPKAAPGEAVATFAEGCFWHSEIVFQSLLGVRDAVSGYSGGSDTHPDYDKVGGGNTGHAESVQVYYDPALVSYRTLVQAFFASQDPTQVNGQGNDRGPQYRSIAFYRNAAEKKIIEEELARIRGQFSKPIATEVTAFTAFYPAEAYHQEYVVHHPDQPYVSHVSIPDYQRFRKSFKGKFKE